MDSRELASKNPLSSERLAPTAKTPVLAAGPQNPALRSGYNPALDHGVRPGYNPALDHGVRPGQEADHGHGFRPMGHEVAADHSLALRPSHEQDHVGLKPAAAPLRKQGALRPHAPGGGERRFFSSDDNALNKQVQQTHAPDMQDNDVRPVLAIVEDILRLARPASDDHTLTAAVPGAHAPGAHAQGAHVATHLDTSAEKVSHAPYHDDKLYQTSYLMEHDIIRMLARPINKISCEIICKCAGGGEAHQMTLDLLWSLSNYSWDSKVVIAFAAFAINYGEFWLVEQHHTTNPLAKNIAALKDLPEILANSSELKKQFESVLDLLHTILKVTHCIIGFKELPPMYISRDSPEITAATAHIPTAVYWCIRALLVCATTLLNLIGAGHEFSTATSTSWEILSLAHKLSVILEHLQKQMQICLELVRRLMLEDAYIKFKRLIESAHIDNMKVIQAFFRPREDQRPLYHGGRATNERLDVLRMKYVLLLISDLDLPPEELHVLHLIHNDPSMTHNYEILWLPVVDPNTKLTTIQDTTFYNLRNSMPWFSADHPSVLEPVLIRYIREELRFTHMPMLVVLDPHGKLSHHDALPMMWIWGAKAFPFTRDWERKLWDESQWNIELIADAIDPRTHDWIQRERVICLYGGDDVNWIRDFTKAARAAAQPLNVPLEMLYVGKRSPGEKVRQCHDVIARENLSHIFAAEYYDYIWFFWVRLQSMSNSKKQIGRTVEDDHIMQILELLTYDSSEKGWAIFSRGNHEITMASGDKVLQVLLKYPNWAYQVTRQEEFVLALDQELRGTHLKEHCHRLILPGQAGYIPEKVVCTECGKTMDKFVMYRCCTD